MNIIFRFVVFSMALTASACDTAPDMSAYDAGHVRVDSGVVGRFSVKKVGVFRDNLAYDNKRGIYIITDSATGKEFLGVSGIGVSELGSHASGKSTTMDER